VQSRKRVSPRYINITATRYNIEATAGAKQHNQAQNKQKRKEKKIMPTSADRQK
jgi:hypothetical protein